MSTAYGAMGLGLFFSWKVDQDVLKDSRSQTGIYGSHLTFLTPIASAFQFIPEGSIPHTRIE